MPRFQCLTLVFSALVLSLTAAPLRSQEFEAHFSDAAIQKRLKALAPVVEAIVERPFDPAPVAVAVNREEMAKLLYEESEILTRQMLAEMDEFLREAALRSESKTASSALFAKVATKGGLIHVVPANFVAVAAKDDALKAVAGSSFLDLILVHELVHVYQNQQHEYGKLLEDIDNREQVDCVSCVLEGHAQWVTRQAAKRLDIEDEFELLNQVWKRVPKSIDNELERALYRSARAQMRFAYTEGESFVTEVIERLGRKEAEAKLFSAPPRGLAEVSRPAEYFNPVDRGVSLRDLGYIIRSTLQGEYRVMQVPLTSAALAPLISMINEDGAAAFREAYREGLLFQATGNIGGSTSYVATNIMRSDSLAGATLIRESITQIASRVEELMGITSADLGLEGLEIQPAKLGTGEGVRISYRLPDPGDGMIESVRFIGTRGNVMLSVEVLQRKGAAERAERFYAQLDDTLLRPAAFRAIDPRSKRNDADAWRKAVNDALDGDDPGLQLFANRILPRADLEDDDRDRRIQAALASKDIDMRLAGLAAEAKALGRKGMSEDRFETLLKDPQLELPRSALRRYTSKLDEGKRAALIGKLLKGEERGLRDELYALLHEYDLEEKISEFLLVRDLSHSEVSVRSLALKALHRCKLYADDEPEVNVLALQRKLLSKDPAVMLRAKAAEMLGEYPELPTEALPELLGALKDEIAVAVNAVDSLGLLAEEGPKVVPALIDALDRSNVTLRRSVVDALGDFGSDAKDAAPRLRELLNDENREVRLAAAVSLAETGETELAPIQALLLEGLESEEWNLNYDALGALNALGPKGASMSEHVLPHLRHEITWVRSTAIEALIAMDKKDGPIQDALLRCIADEDVDIRYPALEGLRKLAATRSFDESALRPLLFANKAEPVTWALECYARQKDLSLPPAASETRWDWLANEDDWQEIEAALGALTALGKRAKPLLPLLERSLKLELDDEYRPKLAATVKALKD